MPKNLQDQVREVFASAGVDPDELGEHMPSWYHDGVLSMLRGDSYADIAASVAESPKRAHLL
ncbi:hypothetical protein [Nonomuraea fuscirosea]|uniref:hypothetical protein n=1 Tax=Nonomuraea fuscirosea TaxID=1291556 RepID=UPI003434BA00